MKFFTKQNTIATILFAIFGLLALQVPVAKLVAGEGASFTLYDFFAPIATAFIGIVPGLISVFLTQLADFIIRGEAALSVISIVRFLTPLAGALYFSYRGRASLLIPIAAIIAFVIHPIGGTVWYFSMFWLVPIIAKLTAPNSLLLRGLGATFTAHAVGGAVWIYALALPAEFWAGLVPVVARERLLFGVGIAVLYLVFNNLLQFVVNRGWEKLRPLVNEQYVLRPLRS
ncbi:MAG: hypothetical protein COU11_02760 [Candidatus Harrisonbacteria bacterium CG10_big_fil_rev_8_21_14_0_10_49_15]|uniref:ECF transporter S component n=1 Tax=Candidatus Harrisonbacteria bacterium CG10_big_fil_rev_8_21_14_0_10_49_15 TaxID=1974587 RepID=A0A2H0UL34_9BACT|nr:MAG: hypothetical protein COU11_02760 [Candidatus Harrisonbacteria bacterium CG10_big_fil_rev_8_21_14_0_10_49_15]